MRHWHDRPLERLPEWLGSSPWPVPGRGGKTLTLLHDYATQLGLMQLHLYNSTGTQRANRLLAACSSCLPVCGCLASLSRTSEQAAFLYYPVTLTSPICHMLEARG